MVIINHLNYRLFYVGIFYCFSLSLFSKIDELNNVWSFYSEFYNLSYLPQNSVQFSSLGIISGFRDTILEKDVLSAYLKVYESMKDLYHTMTLMLHLYFLIAMGLVVKYNISPPIIIVYGTLIETHKAHMNFSCHLFSPY